MPARSIAVLAKKTRVGTPRSKAAVKPPRRKKSPARSQESKHPDGLHTRKAAVVINRSAGTVRTMGAENVAKLIEDGFRQEGIELRVDLIDGKDVSRHIDRLKAEKVQIIVVAGGDGTISSVAGQLAGTPVVLGVLPMGTMNFFAKALGLQGDLGQSVKQLAAAEITAVDVGTANGQVFLHQFSLGMQPKMVRLRERLGYRSRMTKIFAGVRAFVLTMRRPPKLKLDALIDNVHHPISTTAFFISNNPYGPGRLPYQDKLDGGELGIYILTSSRWADVLRLTKNFMAGTWHDDPNVEIHSAQVLKVARRGWNRHKRIIASVDGEILKLPLPVEVAIRPLALKVLKPVPPEA